MYWNFNYIDSMDNYFEKQDKFTQQMIEAFQYKKIPKLQSFEHYFNWKIRKGKVRLNIVDIFRMKCEALAIIDKLNIKRPEDKEIFAYLNAINNELTYIILLCYKE